MHEVVNILIAIPCTIIAIIVGMAMVIPFIEHRKHLIKKKPAPRKKQLPENVVPINKKKAKLIHEIIDLEIERRINQ